MRLESARVVLRPRSLVDIADLTLVFTRAIGWRLLARLALWTLLPSLVLCAVFRFGAQQPWEMVILTALQVPMLFEGVFTVACGQLMFREHVTVGDVWRQFRPRLWAHLGCFFITYVLIVGLSFTLVLPILLWPGLAYWREAVLLEGLGPLAALKRANRFVRRDRVRVYRVGLMMLTIATVCAVTCELLGGALLEWVLQVGRPFGSFETSGASLSFIIGLHLSIPLIATFRFLVWVDERTRQDGWDIQVSFLALARRADPETGEPAPNPAAPSRTRRGAQLVLACLVAAGALVSWPDNAHARPNTSAVEDALRKAMDEADPPFCRIGDFPLTREERAWCPPEPGLAERCPKFADACQAAREAELEGTPGRFATRTGDSAGSEGGRSEGGGSEGGSGAGGQDVDPVDSPDGDGGASSRSGSGRRAEPDRGDLPDWLPAFTGVAEFLFWLIVGVFVIGVLYLLWRLGPGRPRHDEPAPEVVEETATTIDAPITASPSATLWAAAESAAAREAWDEAWTLGHAALLAALHAGGRIQFHPSRTNGDYLRQLRRDPALNETVRPLVHQVEAVHFGHAANSPQTWAGFAAGMTRLFGHLVALIVVTAFGLGLPGCGEDYGAWSESPSGLGLFVATGNALGLSIGYRETPLSGLTVSDGTAVLLVRGAIPSDDELELLRDFSWSGGVVINATGAPFHRLDAMTVEPVDRAVRTFPFDDYELRIATESRVTDLFGDPVTPERVVIGNGTDTYAVRTMHDQNLLFADDRIFTNAGLMAGQNAAALFALLDDREIRRIDILDAFYWEGANDQADVVTSSELTPVLAHLLLLFAVIALWRGTHFGRPRATAVQGRKAWSEHVLAMGRQYARAREPDHALRLYSAWALDVLGGRQVDSDGLAERLANQAARPVADVRHTLETARRAADGRGPQGAEAAAALQALGALVASALFARTKRTRDAATSYDPKQETGAGKD